MAPGDNEGDAAARTVEELEREFGIGGDENEGTAADDGAEPDEDGAIDMDDLLGPPSDGDDEVETAAAALPVEAKAGGALAVGGVTGTMDLALVNVKKLKPAPDFRKVSTKEAEFVTLVESIKQHGILNPLLVKGDQVVAGRRRLEAAKSAGLRKVPVVQIQAEADNAVPLISLLDNLQRKNLDPIEEAQAFQALLDNGVVKNRVALAGVVGVTAAAITQKMAVLELDAPLKKALKDEQITAWAAYELRNADKGVVKTVLNAAKAGGTKPTKRQAREAATGKTAVTVVLPEKAPPEIKSAKVSADGVRLVLDLAHPQKTWKGGEFGKILAVVAKACGEDLDKACNVARKEVK